MTEIRRLRRRDAEYPGLLAAIHDPPPALFVRGGGSDELLSLPAVAVVGARACSAYGRSVARSLGRELAAAGLVVISGMARGIDGEGHRGALEAAGVTVAVLGCGVDRDYPAAHAELARRICERGLIVSEYEPGIEPAPWRFPARKAPLALGKGLCVRSQVSDHTGTTPGCRFGGPNPSSRWMHCVIRHRRATQHDHTGRVTNSTYRA